MLTGRRSLVRARAAESGEVVELPRAHVLTLVQTDAELSEILMRAFIFRRVELIAHGLGETVLVGSVHSPGALRIKEFLTRNGQARLRACSPSVHLCHPFGAPFDVRASDCSMQNWQKRDDESVGRTYR